MKIFFYSTHFSGNKISKTNTLSSPVIVTNLIENVGSPAGIALYANELYFSTSYNHIFKLKLSEWVSTIWFNTSLSLNNFTLKNSIKTFPNPSNDYIKIMGLTNIENYRIFNSIGVEIKNGKIANDEKLDIKNLNNGIYFLRFENGNTIKIIKK